MAAGPRPAAASGRGRATDARPRASRAVRAARGLRGAVAHRAGLAAEAAVEDHYRRAGRAIAARRWRSPHGEIDLVATEGERLVFVEVKRAETFDLAAARVSARQLARIAAAALDYLVGHPRGQDAEMRFDVALVNGRGEVSVLENAWTG
jgi:putative endonuclease